MKIEEIRASLAMQNAAEDLNKTEFWDSRRVLLNASPVLVDLAEAVGRWQHARSYGDSDAAAAEVAEAYARLEALP